MKRLICILGWLLTSNASIVFASSDTRVFPEILELELGQDEMVTEQVSLAVIPTCIVPIDVDVVASDPNARVTNLTGVLTNGCNRSVSSFDIEFTGTGASQAFDLQFVNAQSGRVMDAIPVTITPGPGVEALMGVIIGRRGIVFQVFSNGCTTKDDFQVEVMESIPLQLRLVRLEEDPCRAVKPLGKLVRFSYRELGIQREETLRVVNPLATVQVPGRRRR